MDENEIFLLHQKNGLIGEGNIVDLCQFEWEYMEKKMERGSQ